MSFSFGATGDKPTIVEEIAAKHDVLDNFPTCFAAAVTEQVEALPDGVEITLTCYGHTGWHDNQTSGEISLHAVMQVQTRPNG